MPSIVSRSPRKGSLKRFVINLISSQLYYIFMYYIASEWKLFLPFYIPATLFGVFPIKYYAHVFLMIKAIRVLLSEYIEDRSLVLAVSISF